MAVSIIFSFVDVNRCLNANHCLKYNNDFSLQKIIFQFQHVFSIKLYHEIVTFQVMTCNKYAKRNQI